MRTVSRFLRDESGATAIEYGLIAAGIAVAIIAAVHRLGTDADATFDAVADRAQVRRRPLSWSTACLRNGGRLFLFLQRRR